MEPPRQFRIAPNPDPESKLPYLVSLPLADGPLVLRVREPWPRTGRVYCHRHDGEWPSEAEETIVPVVDCSRRGAAIDLVLDRVQQRRSQFLFTKVRGRDAIFWSTPATAKGARPGARIPRRRPEGFGSGPLTIIVDTRERYAYKFPGRAVTVASEALTVGDYAVLDDRYDVVAAVERKSFDDFASALSDGSLAFVAADLAALPAAAIVVEARYGQLLAHEHAPGQFLADLLARMQARNPGVPIMFCDSRKLAEDYTFRFLAQAIVEHGRRVDEPPEGKLFE